MQCQESFQAVYSTLDILEHTGQSNLRTSRTLIHGDVPVLGLLSKLPPGTRPSCSRSDEPRGVHRSPPTHHDSPSRPARDRHTADSKNERAKRTTVKVEPMANIQSEPGACDTILELDHFPLERSHYVVSKTQTDYLKPSQSACWLEKGEH